MKNLPVVVIILIGIVSLCFVFFVFYLIGCFYSASFDVREWTDGPRYFIASVWSLCTVAFVVFNGAAIGKKMSK